MNVCLVRTFPSFYGTDWSVESIRVMLHQYMFAHYGVDGTDETYIMLMTSQTVQAHGWVVKVKKT